MEEHERQDARQAKLQEAQINRALGAFMLAFGLIVLFSIFFTETTEGKLTNLAAGLLIGGIGGAMVWQARRQSRTP
jgi:hypothetical protein